VGSGQRAQVKEMGSCVPVCTDEHTHACVYASMHGGMAVCGRSWG